MKPRHRPLCPLEARFGRLGRCPGESCAFWEPGGAALPGGCMLERLSADLAGQPDVAALLLDLRTALERAQTGEEADAARARLVGLLDDGDE